MHRKFLISTCIKRWYLLQRMTTIYALAFYALFSFPAYFSRVLAKNLNIYFAAPRELGLESRFLLPPISRNVPYCIFAMMFLVWLLSWLVGSLWDICFQFRRLSRTNKCKFYAKQTTLIVGDIWFGAGGQGSLFRFYLVGTDKWLARLLGT